MMHLNIKQNISAITCRDLCMSKDAEIGGSCRWSKA
jgi:hypothetical protein